jgi:uridine kinase
MSAQTNPRSDMRPLVIGIAGGTGAGKTTIARAIISELPAHAVAYVQHDSYYRDRPDLSADERTRVNYDHPESLDNPLLIDHLDQLLSGEPIERPNYDFVSHRRLAEHTQVPSASVIILEGILIFSDPSLVERCDIKLFIDTPADIRILRRIRRDIERRGRTFEETRTQYYATVRPMHMSFVEPSKYRADLIIPEGGDFRVAIDLIVQRIRSEHRERTSEDITPRSVLRDEPV